MPREKFGREIAHKRCKLFCRKELRNRTKRLLARFEAAGQDQFQLFWPVFHNRFDLGI